MSFLLDFSGRSILQCESRASGDSGLDFFSMLGLSSLGCHSLMGHLHWTTPMLFLTNTGKRDSLQNSRHGLQRGPT